MIAYFRRTRRSIHHHCSSYYVFLLFLSEHLPTCQWRLSSRPTWYRNRLQSGCPGPRSQPRTNRTGCHRWPRSALRTLRSATHSRPSSRRPSGPYRPTVRCTRDVPRPRQGHNLWPTERRRWPLRRSSTDGTTAVVAVKRTAVSWWTWFVWLSKYILCVHIRLCAVSTVRLMRDKR